MFIEFLSLYLLILVSFLESMNVKDRNIMIVVVECFCMLLNVL